ncbi:hypothetical protein TREES_T100000660 [Tupaia chinensis]|uniref:Uncharacterized protein n=1 Tax=Tupaia chinensis TaxID=246437 RepID=L9KTJ9_TUPCH|nr:hypothetical protein TREES_T100000660 [Tupaia chinensis]
MGKERGGPCSSKVLRALEPAMSRGSSEPKIQFNLKSSGKEVEDQEAFKEGVMSDSEISIYWKAGAFEQKHWDTRALASPLKAGVDRVLCKMFVYPAGSRWAQHWWAFLLVTS